MYKYFKEVLLIDDVGAIKFSSFYYAPSLSAMNASSPIAKEGEHPPLSQSLDLSAFLESSTDEITQRATLIVSFLSLADKNLIMRLYFSKIDQVFCGNPIQIFPDACRLNSKAQESFSFVKISVLGNRGFFLLKIFL